MALEDIFNLENFPNRISQILKGLYDPLESGGDCITNFIRDDFRVLLFNEIKGLDFTEAQKQEGKVSQDYEKSYLQFSKIDELGEYPIMQKLVLEYSELYRKLSRFAYFNKGKINSVGVHHYKKGSNGIGPHLDKLSEAINLISIFCIQGNARFGVFTSKDKSEPYVLNNMPGSLILLRAPRNPKENNLRPLHFINNVIDDKYSLILRQEP